jgi:hypothetical protein
MVVGGRSGEWEEGIMRWKEEVVKWGEGMIR